MRHDANRVGAHSTVKIEWTPLANRSADAIAHAVKFMRLADGNPRLDDFHWVQQDLGGQAGEAADCYLLKWPRSAGIGAQPRHERLTSGQRHGAFGPGLHTVNTVATPKSAEAPGGENVATDVQHVTQFAVAGCPGVQRRVGHIELLRTTLLSQHLNPIHRRRARAANRPRAAPGGKRRQRGRITDLTERSPEERGREQLRPRQ